MNISRQKLYATLRKAGYSAAKFHRSGMVRGWGNWSSGVHVVPVNLQGIGWKVEYNFGSSRRASDADRKTTLQAIQRVLIAAGIQCYPNTQETALIIGDPEM